LEEGESSRKNKKKGRVTAQLDSSTVKSRVGGRIKNFCGQKESEKKRTSKPKPKEIVSIFAPNWE